MYIHVHVNNFFLMLSHNFPIFKFWFEIKKLPLMLLQLQNACLGHSGHIIYKGWPCLSKILHEHCHAINLFCMFLQNRFIVNPNCF